MPIAIKVKGDRGFSRFVTNPDDLLATLEATGFTVNSQTSKNIVRELWDALAAGEIEIQTKP
jgi:hypothetical protein